MGGMRFHPRTAHAVGVAILVRLAFACAVYFWNSLPGFHALDTPSYVLPAGELAHSFSFSIDGIPDIYRTPGYSFCLVPGVLIGQVEFWAILLNLAFAAGTTFMVHRIALALSADSRAALASAFLYAVEPLSIFHAAQVTSETAFTFLAVAGLGYLMRYLSSAGPRDLLLAGSFMAAATLVRPIGLYLPWLMAALAVVARFRAAGGRRIPIPHLALFLATAAIPVTAWQVRNSMAAGYPRISVIVDVNNYYFQAAAVRARLGGKALLQTRMDHGYERELWLTEHPRERTVDQGDHFRALGKEAGTVLRQHWPTYLGIHLAGVLKVLTNPGASGYLVVYNRFSEVEALAGVYPDGGALQAVRDFDRMKPAFLLCNAGLGLLLVSYYLAASRGLWRARKTWMAGHTLLLAVACYFAVVSGGANAVSRFRHPIMPLLCVFAGAGLLRGLRPATPEITE